ncbi:MAG: tripartite tricarboxylate transporter substrate binding protein [Burkholderiales bacterium]|nr:tripartite tricarboxylate transporter substrate binding protein [Burkholderiales bacterium]
MKHAVRWMSAGCAVATASAAFAQAPAPAYPVKPVRLLVPFAAGGATDVPTRILATKLGERMGSAFIIDNRPGAGGAIGTATVARAEPDGYTVLVTATPFVVSPHVYPKLTYDALKDFAQVAQFASSPNVLVVHPSLPVKSVKDLIALARPQPGKLDWASSGVGGGQHLFGELFMSMAGIKVTHVSYKGSGAAIADMLGGQVKIGFPGIAIALSHHNAGRLLALGVTTAQRSAQMPDVPSIAEAGVTGYDATFWMGLSVPVKTSRTVIDVLHRETVALVKAPDVVEGFRKAGTDVAPLGPEQFRKFVLSEYEKWGKVVRAVGIKPE